MPIRARGKAVNEDEPLSSTSAGRLFAQAERKKIDRNPDGTQVVHEVVCACPVCQQKHHYGVLMHPSTRRKHQAMVVRFRARRAISKWTKEEVDHIWFGSLQQLAARQVGCDR